MLHLPSKLHIPIMIQLLVNDSLSLFQHYQILPRWAEIVSNQAPSVNATEIIHDNCIQFLFHLIMHKDVMVLGVKQWPSLLIW